MAQVSHTIKSSLARLLASENIIVQHNPGARTASFDVKNRVLTLPVWQDISEDLYDMLVVHETGHALDTPWEGWSAAIDSIAAKYHEKPSMKAKMAVKDFLNVIEDARIDKRQKRRYPGSKRNYLAGYKELMSRNFFGILNKDVNGMGFIDRANIHFKSYDIIIKFSGAEQAFIKKMSNTETFEDVVSLADEVYGYCLAAKQDEASTNVSHKDEDFDDSQDDDEEKTYIYDDESDDESDEDEETDEATDSGEASEDAEESDEESDEDVETENSSSSEKSEDDEVPESETERAARENADSIIKNDDVDYIYVTLPKPNYDLILDDYSKVIPQMEESVIMRYDDEQIASLNKELNEWKQKESETLSFMIKEFETKKSADAYARTSVAKTGTIDTNKLHSYKYNEDIFQKLTVTQTGKNHGFVMILDWSGSMSRNLESTMKQLFTLTMFCKKVQIPFEVYLFRSACHSEMLDMNEKGGAFTYKNGDMEFSNFKLRNILSSRMNLSAHNKAMNMLFIASKAHGLNCDILDSTPLNQAIYCLDKVVNDFQKKSKVQIVNTIILTDGCSDPVYKIHNEDPYNYLKKKQYILRDDKTSMTYSSSSHPRRWYQNCTNVLLQNLKTRTNCNVIGFFLYSGPFKSLHSPTNAIDYTFCDNESNRAFYRENGYIGVTTAGFDEYYIVNTSSENKTDENLNVNSTMTKNKIAKEFMKFSSKKTINRVLLSKFVTRISKQAA